MPEIKRTQFAMKALGLAEMFQAIVGAKPLEGPVKYRVELSTPDGPSTGGGAQAVQHISLVSDDGSRTIVMGNANQVEKAAQLRTFERLVEQHARRYKGLPFTIEQTSYEQLLSRIETFLQNQGFKVTREEPEQKLVIGLNDQEALQRVQSSVQSNRSQTGTAAATAQPTARPAPAQAAPPLAKTPTAPGFKAFPPATQSTISKSTVLWMVIGAATLIIAAAALLR